MLNALFIRGKGRPKGALGGQDQIVKSRIKRLSSAFELPSSSATAALDRPQEKVFVVQTGLSSTTLE
jgi:hypothetical protein